MRVKLATRVSVHVNMYTCMILVHACDTHVERV